MSLTPELIAAAQTAQRKWGVPASVSLAQFGLESGWGEHMPPGSNNPFGIKVIPGQPFVAVPTHEFIGGRFVTVTAKFAAYVSFAEAFDAHARLLATHPIYADAMAKLPDVNEFAVAMAMHYATDPNYAGKLIGLMRMGNLYQYDVAPAAPTPTAPQEAPLPDPAPIAVTVTQPAPAPVPPPAITPLATTPAKPPVSIPFRITLGTAGGAVVAGGAALAVSHPVTAVDLSPLLTPLIQIAGLVLTGLVGWAATRVAAYAHISSQNSLLQSVLAAVDRGINYGQQVATAAAQKDATVNVTSATQAAAVQYVTSKLPGTLAKLGMTPAHVADLVLAKLPTA